MAHSAASVKASVSQFQAVGLALAAFTFWVFADTALKIAGASSLPSLQVIAIVGLAEVVFLVAYAFARRELATLWPRNPVRQLLRSCLDLVNNVCVVIALRHLPLAMFYLLIFLAPLVASILATLFLHEPLRWRQALAVGTGFLGVVIAVDPFASVRPADSIGYLACSVCVVCFSANLVWSRRMTQTESPQSLAFVAGVLMAVVGLVAALPHLQPLPWRLITVLAAAGLFWALGSFCFFVALKHTSAATVAQYHYSQLLTGALLGYAIWREKITLAMLGGAVLIVGSGCYTAARSHAGSLGAKQATEG